jgi:hypothetical protein
VVRIDLTLDCADATVLAAFWKQALGYVDEPPPAPFATRQQWLDSFGPAEEGDEDEAAGAWLHHPSGTGPRLCLLRVPEPKTAKNRLHIDVRVAGSGTPAERWARITAKVAELTAAGATVLWQADGHHVTMADPEGNEFCVACG